MSNHCLLLLRLLHSDCSIHTEEGEKFRVGVYGTERQNVLNKSRLSYRGETALQGGLVVAKRGRLEQLRDNI